METGVAGRRPPCKYAVVSTTPGQGTVGSYEVLHEIGRGKSGVVYRVRDTVRHRVAVLKVVPFEGTEAERESCEKRFFEEAESGARLAHPGIVTVLDAFKSRADGSLCLVFEQVDGRPLSSELEDGRLFPWREALSLVEHVADALQHAHEKGVVHGAIRPSNLLLLPSGEPKVTDFGVAGLRSTPVIPWPPREVTDALFYLSPEQIVGEPVDSMTDIFSLGAIAYRLLTGRLAFEASDPRTIFSRIIHDEPSPPSWAVHGLPKEADEVVARALAKSRKDRYNDARTLSRDVVDILEGRHPRHTWSTGHHDDRATRAGASPPPVTTPAKRAPAGEPKDLKRRLVSRGLAAILAFGLIAVLEALRPAPGPPGTTLPPDAPVSDGLPQAGASSDSSVLPDVGLPSLEEPPESSRLVIELQHPLHAGTLRVFIDEEEVLERAFRGSITRSLLRIKLHGGHMREVVQVGAGRRRVKVQVQWEDGESSDNIVGAFREGSTYRLSVRMGRLSKGLKLEWR